MLRYWSLYFSVMSLYVLSRCGQDLKPGTVRHALGGWTASVLPPSSRFSMSSFLQGRAWGWEELTQVDLVPNLHLQIWQVGTQLWAPKTLTSLTLCLALIYPLFPLFSNVRGFLEDASLQVIFCECQIYCIWSSNSVICLGVDVQVKIIVFCISKELLKS